MIISLSHFQHITLEMEIAFSFFIIILKKKKTSNLSWKNIVRERERRRRDLVVLKQKCLIGSHGCLVRGM